MGRKALPAGELAFHRSWERYRQNAETRSLTWALDRAQVRKLVFGDCGYCGAKAKPAVKTRLGLNGIDRVDNEKGYVADNVVSCCARCNRMKGKISLPEFLDAIRALHRHLL